MKKSELFKAFVKAARSAKLVCAAIVLCVAGAVALALLPPLLLENIVDKLTSFSPVSFMEALSYFALLALSGIFDAAKEIFVTLFGQRTTRTLREEMCAKLSRLPAAYFTANQPGMTSSLFVNDVDALDKLFSSGVISLLTDACKLVGLLVVIFIKSRGLGIIMLLLTPPLYAMTRAFQKKMLSAQSENRLSVAKVNEHIPETIKNIRMIHTFHKQAYMSSLYDKYIQRSYSAIERSNFYDSVYSPIILLTASVVVAVVMVLAATGGALREFFGMSVGAAVAVIAYVGKFFDPLQSIGMEIQSIQEAVAAMERINVFLSEPERITPDFSMQASDIIDESFPCVELKDVCFSYSEGNSVLSNVSFKVKTGESVTITGRTGAGKSTAFKLLLGLYEPQSGSVLIYNKQAHLIPDKEKRKLFGYVEQSFRMVPGSVEDQISLFDESITASDVEKAAKLVGLHDRISALPEGYSEPCREGLFSQGEWQLMAIARAVAAEPSVLLLDEITANLDAATEEAVLKAIQKAAEKRTVIAISHRLYEKLGARIVTIGE